MANERWGRVIWPGVLSPRTGTYTMSHGIAAGTAMLRINPQVAPFATFGDLVFTDGISQDIVLRGCRLDRVRETRGPDGVEWELSISDARWKWREAGYVKMWANQLDPHGKFIPWTIRSPIELAEACLKALGVTRYRIDLPIGLTRADGEGQKEFLPTGVNFPVSGVNPPIDWFYEPAAPALESLADSFGCRVVPRWDQDEVWIVQRGNGADLPPGSIASRTPTVTASQTPDAAMVVGSATRFQVMLPLQAAGEDWDGIPRPINGLSYAPIRSSVTHQVLVTGTYIINYQYYVVVNGISFSAGHNTGETSLAAIVGSIAGQIIANTNPALADVMASSSATTISIFGKKPGVKFDCSVQLIYVGSAQKPRRPKWGFNIARNAAIGGPDWSRSYAPLFPGVRATDRLTLGQARDLARKSVWKYYMLTGGDISDNGPIFVPGYGRLTRRQQLVLLDTQCAQVVPAPADMNLRMKDGLGTPWVQNQYNGYSRDVPAAVYGSVLASSAKHLWNMASMKNGLNTGPYDQVQVDFGVDPVYQMVRFSDHVYKWGKGGSIEEPALRLLTAVHVRDPDDNSLIAFERKLTFPGRPEDGKVIVVEKHDDVQLNVVPVYANNGTVTDVGILEADPINRADYFLRGIVNRLVTTGGLVQEYNGLMPIQLDGAIAQITWEVGEPSPSGGAKTVASRNFEHNTAVPPYGARRRQEAVAAAVRPGGFMGELAGSRQSPTAPTPFKLPKSNP